MLGGPCRTREIIPLRRQPTDNQRQRTSTGISCPGFTDQKQMVSQPTWIWTSYMVNSIAEAMIKSSPLEAHRQLGTPTSSTNPAMRSCLPRPPVSARDHEEWWWCRDRYGPQPEDRWWWIHSWWLVVVLNWWWTNGSSVVRYGWWLLIDGWLTVDWWSIDGVFMVNSCLIDGRLVVHRWFMNG